jgi:hypothetical protein
MHIEGEIAIGEAAGYAAKATSRINGHPKPMILSVVLTVVIMLSLSLVFTGLQNAFGWPGWLFLPAIIIAAMLAAMVSSRLGRDFAIRIARRELAGRGLRNPVVNRFEVMPDGFRSLTGSVESRAPWSAVSDLFPIGPYWVVIADAWPFYMPRRFFSSVEEEKRFLTAMLANMGEDARARSDAAARFAAS